MIMSRKIKRRATKKESLTLPSRLEMERITADLSRLLHGKDFKNLDEANAFIKKIVSGGGLIPHSDARSPLEEAQDLVYDAWEASTPQKAAELARWALTIAPDCADGYNVLAE